MSHTLGEYAIVLDVTFAILGVALVLTFVRLLQGPSLPDRVVAFDLSTIIVLGILAVHSVASDTPVLLDVGIVLALITFLATIGFAQSLARRAGGKT
ncbi:MAG TPA: monovalent cation/H+ antiporter complex subunit F [Candidatus Thermoplasmatota archaeon]|nr:monovalent cation/H+ antiporter complex subunit F [Candidatus Thermoplasmatota archaeon]